MKSLTDINKLNSGLKTDYILELQEKIDSLSQQDLTPGQVEIQQLQLAKRLQEAKELEDAAKREFELSIKKIEEDAALSRAELELHFQTRKGLAVEELVKESKALEDRVIKGKEELTFGLRKKQAEHNEKIRQLEEEFTKKEEDLNKKFLVSKEKNEANLKVVEEKAKVDQEKILATIDTLKKDQEQAKITKELAIQELKEAKAREITKIDYDHKLAIETKDIDTTTKILKGYQKTAIPVIELDELRVKAKDNEKLKNEEVDKIKKDAESRIYSQEGAKLTKLKAQTDQDIAILNAKNEHLELQVKESKARIDYLEQQISQFPTQLREAVEAAKTPINQFMDSNKK